MSDDEDFDRSLDFSLEHSCTPADDPDDSRDMVSLSSVAKRVPLNQCPALLLMRESVEDFEDQVLSAEQFCARVTKLHNKTEHHLSQFTREMKRALAEAKSNDDSLAQAMESALETILDGCEHLLNFEESQDVEDLDTGLDLIEQGFEEMDRAEAQALEAIEELEAAS